MGERPGRKAAMSHHHFPFRATYYLAFGTEGIVVAHGYNLPSPLYHSGPESTKCEQNYLGNVNGLQIHQNRGFRG